MAFKGYHGFVAKSFMKFIASTYFKVYKKLFSIYQTFIEILKYAWNNELYKG